MGFLSGLSGSVASRQSRFTEQILRHRRKGLLALGVRVDSGSSGDHSPGLPTSCPRGLNIHLEHRGILLAFLASSV